MTIDINHLNNICKFQKDGVCAFLALGNDGFECAKDISGLEAQIRKRLEAGTMRAKDDNCHGYNTYVTLDNITEGTHRFTRFPQ